MNKKKITFCKLMATGVYTSALAVSLVWKNKYDDDAEAANYLMDNKQIKKRITLEREGRDIRATASPEWIKSKLVEMVEMSSVESPLFDPNVMRYSLDMLNKMNGNYNEDESQRKDITLIMDFGQS